jgi:hypothetical protein
MKEKNEYLQRIQKLLKVPDSFKYDLLLSIESSADCQYWFSSIMTMIQSITDIDDYFYNEALHIIKNSKRQGGISPNEIEMMKGFLRQIYDAIDNNLLLKIKNKITVQDFSDFLEHAKDYAKDNKKIEASIIASAIFEDTIKKIALKNGISIIEKLDSLINALKTKGIISTTEAKKFKYFSGVRNSALHASWDEFTIQDINNLITGDEILFKDYLT